MEDTPESPRRQGRHIDIDAPVPLPLEDALSIVGQKTRADIIVALGEARTTDPTVQATLEFSELMDRVAVEDSGRFNYHLDKLVDSFIEKRDDGYTLKLPGQLFYESLVAGTLTDRRAIDPFPVGPCPECTDALTAAYHPDHLLTVECVECATLYDAMHFPARGLDSRTPTEILDAAYTRRHHKVATMRQGACQRCAGIVSRKLVQTASITYGSAPIEEMAGLETYAVMECSACHSSVVGHPANIGLTTPQVGALFSAHDLAVTRARWWEEPTASARTQTTLINDDPRTVRIPFEIDGDRQTIVLDADLQVTADGNGGNEVGNGS